MRYANRIILCVLFCFSPTMALAGNLDDTGSPTTSGGGAMNTLEDIYNILNDGTTNAPRTGTFTEPSAGPAGTGHTLTEVYDRAKTSSRPAKTGQTTSYGVGSDGNLQKGVTWPNPRFTDNSDGTVTDNLTGLMWLKVANYNSTTGTTGTTTWANAFSFCNSLQSGQCGLSDNSVAGDWRLPNVKELQSLIDFAYYNPSLSNAAGTGQWTSGDAFTGVQSYTVYIYWSSTTSEFDTDDAWSVYISNGTVYRYDKGNEYYVWPVRGGQ